jgi:hypothetical protein
MLRRTIPLERTSPAPMTERAFSLRLSVKVEGHNAAGHKFIETSTLESMSAATAVFGLRAAVERGHLLRLTIDLPPKLSDKDDLKLIIHGTVAAVKPSEGSGQRILLKLDSKYVIKPEDREDSIHGSA